MCVVRMIGTGTIETGIFALQTSSSVYELTGNRRFVHRNESTKAPDDDIICLLWNISVSSKCLYEIRLADMGWNTYTGVAMKRRFPPFNPTNGVRTDFESLLQRFTETESVRYDDFSAIWREMKFSMIFAGRQDDREVQDFVDECFIIAMKFYLPPYSFQIRVGGLYILYGIYFTQPAIRKRKIRVTSVMWNTIIEFQGEAHLQEHLDVEFIFHKLRSYEAFQFCATETYVYPNKSDAVVEDVTTREEFKEEQSLLYDLFSTDVLEQLAAVHQHYHHMKVAMENQRNIRQEEPETDMPAKSLDVIQQDLVPSITKAVINYQEKRKAVMYQRKHVLETESEGELEEDYSVFLQINEGTSRQSLVKSKAYKKLAKSCRSRQYRQKLEQDSEEKKSLKTHLLQQGKI